jgi:hypothetical protein
MCNCTDNFVMSQDRIGYFNHEKCKRDLSTMIYGFNVMLHKIVCVHMKCGFHFMRKLCEKMTSDVEAARL